MQLYDLHTHTTMSDGQADLDTLVSVEQSMGRIVGVSDHAFCCKMFTERDVAAYLEALKPYPVYRGIETNMEQNFSLPDSIDRELDYVIASVHSMPDGRGGFISLDGYFCKRAGETTLYTKNYSSDLSRWYLAYIIRLIEKAFSSQRIDILGHATVNPCCEELYGTKFLLDWENAILNLCKRYGIALEIASLWRAPDFDMLRRAKEMGIRFSMGSDCHHLQDIGVLDYGERAIEELGLTEEDFFVPARAL